MLLAGKTYRHRMEDVPRKGGILQMGDTVRHNKAVIGIQPKIHLLQEKSPGCLENGNHHTLVPVGFFLKLLHHVKGKRHRMDPLLVASQRPHISRQIGHGREIFHKGLPI